MKIKNIRYILPIDDLYNDSLDGFVTLDDGYCMDEFSYWVEVTTPQNLSALI